MIDTSKIEVQRHNGQNPYGPWISANDDSVPGWVIDYAADEIAENDADEGQVERGGSIWMFRRAN